MSASPSCPALKGDDPRVRAALGPAAAEPDVLLEVVGSLSCSCLFCAERTPIKITVSHVTCTYLKHHPTITRLRLIRERVNCRVEKRAAWGQNAIEVRAKESKKGGGCTWDGRVANLRLPLPEPVRPPYYILVSRLFACPLRSRNWDHCSSLFRLLRTNRSAAFLLPFHLCLLWLQRKFSTSTIVAGNSLNYHTKGADARLDFRKIPGYSRDISGRRSNGVGALCRVATIQHQSW